MNKIINYTDKPINEFTTQDTFYGIKKSGGYVYWFLLQFIKFEKGMITGSVCGKIEPNSHNSIWIGKEHIKQGSEISFRISKCSTFSKTGHVWFEKQGKQYKCALINNI